MNDRIKLLAERAGYFPDNTEHWDMPEFQKFIELIVDECANVTYENSKDRPYLYTIIKKHFT